jgi:hypothetical protein
MYTTTGDNGGLRRVQCVWSLWYKTENGGLETRHVSSPRYVLFIFIFLLLIIICIIYRPTQAHDSHTSQ